MFCSATSGQVDTKWNITYFVNKRRGNDIQLLCCGAFAPFFFFMAEHSYLNWSWYTQHNNYLCWDFPCRMSTEYINNQWLEKKKKMCLILTWIQSPLMFWHMKMSSLSLYEVHIYDKTVLGNNNLLLSETPYFIGNTSWVINKQNKFWGISYSSWLVIQMRIQQVDMKGQVIHPFSYLSFHSANYAAFLIDFSSFFFSMSILKHHSRMLMLWVWQMDAVILISDMSKQLLEWFKMIQTSKLIHFPFGVQQKVGLRSEMLHICVCPVCCPLREA